MKRLFRKLKWKIKRFPSQLRDCLHDLGFNVLANIEKLMEECEYGTITWKFLDFCWHKIYKVWCLI